MNQLTLQIIDSESIITKKKDRELDISKIYNSSNNILKTFIKPQLMNSDDNASEEEDTLKYETL